jgi:hypothetical protein
MKFACLLLLMISCASLTAQETSVFVPPKAYPVSRYEAGWNKNPFTLKTAPVVAASASFAADLAIGAYFGDAENPTVIVVNTKTGERTPIRKDKPAANGMKLDDVTIGSGRKDVAADVSLGKETAKLQFNDGYLKQMAAAEAPKAPQGQPQQHQQPGGAPSRVPVPGAPGQPPGIVPQKPGMGTAQTPGQQPKIVLPGAGAGQIVAQVPGQPPRNVAAGQQLRIPTPGVVSTAPQSPGYQAAASGNPTVPSRIRVVGVAPSQ